MAEDREKPAKERLAGHQRAREAEAEVNSTLQSIDEQIAQIEQDLAEVKRTGTRSSGDQPELMHRADSATRKGKKEADSLLTLIFGAGLAAGGAYLLVQRVTISSGAYYWNRWIGGGQESFGLTLIPLLIGIGLLVYGKSALGWALTGIGSLIIILGLLADLHMTFRPSSLFDVLLMLGMIAAGLALAARSLRRG